MAEARCEEGEDEGERREMRDRSHTSENPERPKPEILHSSQGPLSSLRAAIKRTKTNSQSDNRDRRQTRPEITIVAAEPLASNSWFSRASVVFPSQSGWSTSIQPVSQLPPSYDQVIKEKTQEDHTLKPTAAPRRTTCTTTSATQTDPVHQDPGTTATWCGGTSPLAEKRSAGKKPQKPPRPSLPRPANRQPETETDEKVVTNTPVFTNAEDQSDSQSGGKQLKKSDSTATCTRSVTVYWNIPVNPLSVAPVPGEPTSSNCDHSQRPIPRPRTKSLKQTNKGGANIQTLVELTENFDDNQFDQQNISSNKYLKELLEVFTAENECEENGDILDQPNEASQSEDAVGEMNSNNSQRNIRARIQAFESQPADEEGNVNGSAKPELPSRKPTSRPPVAAKPSVALKPQFSQSIDEDSQNISTTNTPHNLSTDPRPQPPKTPVGVSIKEELEALHSKGSVFQRSRPVLTRANEVFVEEQSSCPPKPPAKPVKEPLKPNLNINNHNSASMVRENEYVECPINPVPVKPPRNVGTHEGALTRQSTASRPTTIRVPSQTSSNHFQDGPPPLPAQKPVGSLNNSLNHRKSLPSNFSLQDSFSAGPVPSLPPRKPSVIKSLPPRPPAAKIAPGRPPQSLQATGRSHSAPWETSPKPQPQKPHRKECVLPPRPYPGHRLYNKYILQLPHGIASFGYNGSNSEELSFQKNEVLLLLREINHNEFECQVGENRGRVHRSCMKIITPLAPDMSPSQGATPAASSGGGSGLNVQAIHDFNPEGPGELRLRVGDVVTMVEKVDNEWYRGTCRGSTGFFPINYVKVLSNTPKPLPERRPKPPSATVSDPRCVARFDFEGEHSDELSFSEGDVIQLKEYVGQDWARGQNGAFTGIFPLNFVEIIEDLPPPPSQQQSAKIALPGMAAASPSIHPGVAKPAQASQSSVEWVVALYDYAGITESDLSFQEGDRILITQHINAEWSSGRLNGREGMFPMTHVESTTGQQLSKNHQNGTAGGRKARALYSFTSDCDEELSLQVGDIINNLETIDDEWFLGDLRGKRALVPKNYVQVLE